MGVSFTFCFDTTTYETAAQLLFLVPPILLASIALQESSCNPSTVGGNGEQGLMQLTRDKCGGAPGGNCQDVVRIICSLVIAKLKTFIAFSGL